MRSPQGRSGTPLAKRLLVGVCIAFALLIAVVGLPGFTSLVEARREARSLVNDIARLRRENNALREKARSLKQDPAAIEDVARRELGMLRRGEVLFFIKPVPKPTR
jgi:cell division protein FtsB